MAVTPTSGKITVPVYTPGMKFAQKPQYKTIDIAGLKYAPTQTPTPKPTPKPTKTVGIFSKIGSKIKKGASKVGNGLKNVGTKLTKTKGGKAALIGLGIGALLIGAGLLINKLTKKDNEPDPAAETPTNPVVDPNEPGAEEPTKPGAEDPAKPGAEDPAKPGAEDPAKPGAEDPAKPGAEDPAKPGAENPANPGVIPALPGEKEGGSWAVAEDKNFKMVCSDASGRTRNIKGKLEVQGEYEKNPEEFTITDKSSGEDHVYKYKKIGVNDDGQPIYKCVSMNDRETTTDNQYTLEWKDEKTPTLVQKKHQDNYGIGLRFKA